MSEEVLLRIGNLLASQNLAVLGTSNHGHPYTSLVVYAELQDLSRIIFFTRRDRVKYRNLKSDSRVSLYIDSREKEQRDPSGIEGISLTGVSWEIKPGEEFNELRELYIRKNQHMDIFARDPESTLFRINIETIKYVVNFDEAYEINI